MVEALKLALVGPGAGHAAEERLPGWERPSNWYLTGFLIPSGAPPEQSGDADEDDEMSEVPETAGLAEESAEDRRAAKKGYFPSPMGLSFLDSESTRALPQGRAFAPTPLRAGGASRDLLPLASGDLFERIVHALEDIRSVQSIFSGQRIELPEKAGIYTFWWIGKKARLMSANRHIVLKGPGGRPVNVEYRDWWPPELSYPCLYVGKTTNIKRRFSLHIKRRCPGRLHSVSVQNKKVRPATTSCHLRFGIEHVFPREQKPLDVILSEVGYSYRTDFSDNAVAERFFEEDRLIGRWRPWFNIDSER